MRGGDEIEKLLGGVQRTRLLRLFTFNPGSIYDRDDAAKRIRTTPAVASRELQALLRIGLIRKKTFYKAYEKVRRGEMVTVKKRVPGYVLDEQFPYFEELREFLLSTLPISYDDIVRELRSHGRVRMVALSGFFLHNWERRLDILIVADKVNDHGLSQAIHMLEATLGRELSYACLTSDDFRYRMSIQDRLVRDVFDYEHEVILDRIDL